FTLGKWKAPTPPGKIAAEFERQQGSSNEYQPSMACLALRAMDAFRNTGARSRCVMIKTRISPAIVSQPASNIPEYRDRFRSIDGFSPSISLEGTGNRYCGEDRLDPHRLPHDPGTTSGDSKNTKSENHHNPLPHNVR